MPLPPHQPAPPKSPAAPGADQTIHLPYDLAPASNQTGPARPHANPPNDPNDPTDLPEIPGYDLLAQVGEGGMGVVYEGQQRATGRRVAVKVLGAHPGSRVALLRERFEREIELAARLHHPQIVQVLDAGTTSSAGRLMLYYVMEFIDGVSLDKHCHPGLGSVRKAAALLASIADAVDYAHERGVLHRDLKPSNILIDARGLPHVLDFGLAKAIDPDASFAPTAPGAYAAAAASRIRENTLSQPGQLLGTLGYMPPEQARGRHGEIGIRSDVYALGAMFYQVLAGRIPIDVSGPLGDVLDKIDSADPLPPSALRPSLSPDVDAVLLRALEKDPRARYDSASDLAAELRRIAADEPVEARTISGPERAVRWVRRNALISILAASAAIGLCFAFGSGIVSYYQQKHAVATAEQTRRASIIDTVITTEALFFESAEALRATRGGNAVRDRLLDRAVFTIERLTPEAHALGIADRLGPLMGKLGDVLAERGDTARAERLWKDSLAIARARVAAITAAETEARPNSSTVADDSDASSTADPSAALPPQAPANFDLGLAILRAAPLQTTPAQRAAQCQDAVTLLNQTAVEASTSRGSGPKPISDDVNALLARARLALGRAWAEAGDLPRARTELSAALALSRSLLFISGLDPAARASRFDVTLGHLRQVSRTADESKSAEIASTVSNLCAEISAQAESLADPDDSIRRCRVDTAVLRAQILLRSGAVGSADDELTRARVLGSDLLFRSGDDPRARLALTRLHAIRADIATRQDRHPEACDNAAVALDLIRPAWNAAPREPLYHAAFIETLDLVATKARSAGKPAVAAALSDEYLTVTDESAGYPPSSAFRRAEIALTRAAEVQAGDNHRAKVLRELAAVTLSTAASRRPLTPQEQLLVERAK